MGRPPCCDKANVKRGLWTPEEDAKLLAYVANHGIGNWTLVPKIAGLSRCGKSCRLRWTNYLRPDLKHDNFTPEEEQLILDYHKAFGSRWSFIAQQLPGRTDNDVKNYWNTKLKKKLTKMGIDPITHKPISQILCDYEKISTLQNTTRNQNTPTPPTFLNNNNINVVSTNNSSIHYQFDALSLSEVHPMPPPPPPPLNAAEFLLENCAWDSKEALVPSPVGPYVPMMSVQNNTSVFDQYQVQEEIVVGAKSSSGNSFVEEILDRDSEMKSEFPEFLNQYFNY